MADMVETLAGLFVAATAALTARPKVEDLTSSREAKPVETKSSISVVPKNRDLQ